MTINSPCSTTLVLGAQSLVKASRSLSLQDADRFEQSERPERVGIGGELGALQKRR